MISVLPRLGFVIADILNLQPYFFHDFPGNSLLQSLSDLVESRYQRVKSITPSGILPAYFVIRILSPSVTPIITAGRIRG